MRIVEKVWRAPGGEIHYWTCFVENKRPWLVFLPGLTADRHLFDRQMVELGKKFNCLVWDAPGHGRSRPFALDFSLDDLAEYLAQILRKEEILRPVLVGQSMGGYIAQAFLRRHPHGAAGFVSIDSAPLNRQYYTKAELVLLRHTERMYLSIPWEPLIEWGARGTAATPNGQRVMRWMMRSYEQKEFCALAAHGYRMLAEAVEETGRNYEIKCPVLLLCGEKDGAGSCKRYSKAWSRKTGYTLVWVPEAGHNSNTDAPAFVNAKIEQFIQFLPVERGV